MATAYPYAAIRSTDQWRRVAHDRTELLSNHSGITLRRRDAGPGEDPEACDEPHWPLAFDPWCRLYRLDSERGNINRWRWSADPARGVVERGSVELLHTDTSLPGDFGWTLPERGIPCRPLGMAIDSSGRLFVAETDADKVHVFDLVDRRLLRTVLFPAGSRPAAMASAGDDVYAVVSYGVMEFTAFTDPRMMPESGSVAGIQRLAAVEGEVVGLIDPGSEGARIVSLKHGLRTLDERFATDIAFLDSQHLVIARGCDRSFLQYRYLPHTWTSKPLLVNRLRAKGYDGRGIVATPDHRIGYFWSKGFRTALHGKPRYETRGKAVTFALDGAEFQNQWGIVYIDACIPEQCDVRIRFHTSDDLPEFNLLPRTPAHNDSGFGVLPHDELSPSMPDQRGSDNFAEQPAYRLYRRGDDDELAWSEATEAGAVTSECPVHAPPGRYLWVMLELIGTGRRAPRIHALRAQTQGHSLISHLPALYSRNSDVSSFLRRYLAMPDSLQSYFDTAAFFRHVLLDPCSSPADMLPWLAGFVGLVLDERFDEGVRRRLVQEAVWLFRFRGTIKSLSRFLEIYIGVSVLIIEHYKVRGLGGALVGAEHPEDGNAVLGAGYRVGLALGQEESQVGGADSITEPLDQDRHAHRFTVLVPALLSSEQADVVDHIITTHRPAHTIFDVCTVEAGMRMGRGLHLDLTSIVGHSGGFMPLQVDASFLGRGSTVGFAGAASSASGGRVDIDARLG